MDAHRRFRRAVSGYDAVSPAERAGFWMLSSFGASIGISRGINYIRERRRKAPRLRSWARRAYHLPGRAQPRVHHFLPGIGLAFAAAGTAILTRRDGHEIWFSLPFGTGAGLTLDEIGLLMEIDNPYWRSETLALAQAGLAALAAAALAVRFYCRGEAATGVSAGAAERGSGGPSGRGSGARGPRR
jgi:hypothetical protein